MKGMSDVRPIGDGRWQKDLNPTRRCAVLSCMAAPRESDEGGQRPNMWEELNRPKPDRPTTPTAPPPPAATEVLDPQEPAADNASSLATDAMARINPEHLLLVGAALFVAVAFFAIRGLGSSDVGLDTQAAPADVVATVPAPEQLAEVDKPTTTVATTTTAAPPAMAMGLPAALLDTAQSQVFRLYRTALGREPDRSGFEFWSDQVRADVPLERLAQQFLASEEYQLQFGPGNSWDERAEQLLSNAFGPASDRAELDVWRGRFRGLDGAALLLAISEADETLVATGTLR